MLCSREKKISLHRKSFKKVYNNFQITSSLLIPNYPVEPCTTEADWMHWASAGKVKFQPAVCKNQDSQRDTPPTFAADSLKMPWNRRWKSRGGLNRQTSPSCREATVPGTPWEIRKEEKTTFSSFTATAMVSDLAWLQTTDTALLQGSAVNIGALQSTACPQWLLQWLLRIKRASPWSKCWLPSKPEEALQENIV